jgi:hypothetical protein
MIIYLTKGFVSNLVLTYAMIVLLILRLVFTIGIFNRKLIKKYQILETPTKD